MCLARVSGGIPRKAKHHLFNLRRHFRDAEHRKITSAQIRQFLKAFRIDRKGLQPTEREYMRYLLKTDKSSLEWLALHLGMDDDYVKRQVEPVLKRAGFIRIGGRGRELTEAGRDWIIVKKKKTT